MTSEILISTKLFLNWRMRLSIQHLQHVVLFLPGFPRRRAIQCSQLPTVSATAPALPTFPNPLLCLWTRCVAVAGCGAWVCRQAKCSLSKERPAGIKNNLYHHLVNHLLSPTPLTGPTTKTPKIQQSRLQRRKASCRGVRRPRFQPRHLAVVTSPSSRICNPLKTEHEARTTQQLLKVHLSRETGTFHLLWCLPANSSKRNIQFLPSTPETHTHF